MGVSVPAHPYRTWLIEGVVLGENYTCTAYRCNQPPEWTCLNPAWNLPIAFCTVHMKGIPDLYMHPRQPYDPPKRSEDTEADLWE